MTTYTVISKQLTDDYAVLQTLENASFEIGQEIVVADVDADFNGTVIVYALPQYYYNGTNENGFPSFDPNIPINNQVMYVAVGNDVERAPSTGTIEFDPVCEWIDDQDIADWLGIEVATAGDEAFLIVCAAAANAFCSLRRFENGYFDSLSVAPTSAVKLGTTMYGGALYRQRGSAGQDFATFDGMSQGSTNGLSAIVKQLLGINRAVVA
jgi:hypothetical protein